MITRCTFYKIDHFAENKTHLLQRIDPTAAITVGPVKGSRDHVSHFSEAPHRRTTIVSGLTKAAAETDSTQPPNANRQQLVLRISNIQDAYLRRLLQRSKDLPRKGVFDPLGRQAVILDIRQRFDNRARLLRALATTRISSPIYLCQNGLVNMLDFLKIIG